MKKITLVIITSLLFVFTGCNNDKTILECIKPDDTAITVIKNSQIIKFSNNNEEEEVTDEEWETLKNFYGFMGDETNEEIANTLKRINEEIGYSCEIK